MRVALPTYLDIYYTSTTDKTIKKWRYECSILMSVISFISLKYTQKKAEYSLKIIATTQVKGLKFKISLVCYNIKLKIVK